MRNTIIFFAILVGLGFGYLYYLERGCEMGGVMTWDGKVCVENL